MLPITQLLLALAFLCLGVDAMDGQEAVGLMTATFLLGGLAAVNEIVRHIVAATTPPSEPERPLAETMFEDDAR